MYFFSTSAVLCSHGLIIILSFHSLNSSYSKSAKKAADQLETVDEFVLLFCCPAVWKHSDSDSDIQFSCCWLTFKRQAIFIHCRHGSTFAPLLDFAEVKIQDCSLTVDVSEVTSVVPKNPLKAEQSRL